MLHPIILGKVLSPGVEAAGDPGSTPQNHAGISRKDGQLAAKMCPCSHLPYHYNWSGFLFLDVAVHHLLGCGRILCGPVP